MVYSHMPLVAAVREPRVGDRPQLLLNVPVPCGAPTLHPFDTTESPNLIRLAGAAENERARCLRVAHTAPFEAQRAYAAQPSVRTGTRARV
jgi:hypothetical protein